VQTMPEQKPTVRERREAAEREEDSRIAALHVPDKPHDPYIVPLVKVSIPRRFVDVVFWGSLVGSAALGAVDPPLAVLIGAGVVVARHRSRR
jgi:hypothetical protein